MNNTNNIYQKLEQIQSKLTHLTKSEQNRFQHYKYVSEYQILTILKPLLAETKLILLLSDTKDTTGQNTDIAKAKGSAETYAIKYFLQKLFLIPTSDNLDPDKLDTSKPKEIVATKPLTEAEKEQNEYLINYALNVKINPKRKRTNPLKPPIYPKTMTEIKEKITPLKNSEDYEKLKADYEAEKKQLKDKVEE
ncbi:19672_t:CDS:2 [Funneliformis geosporum]|uniref:19672_t:CDS:1 n=1 Tax=Funneliformis geosporum TaxID=1117311 RepID=A0A9W4SVR7_9GLOM|nr:19672_t:CDS:2 [Funneliformis geosporum]